MEKSTEPQHPESHHRGRARLGAFALGAAACAALAWGPAFLRPGSKEGDLLPRLLRAADVEADIDRGDYLFLPCRREMWVVNRANGKFLHYQFFENELGTVERSRQPAMIDLKAFPLKDTEFLLSDRNFTPYLWVVNRATGSFQMWRSNRDGSLSTDEYAVEAGEHLRAEVQRPERLRRTDRSSVKPGAPRPAGKTED